MKRFSRRTWILLGVLAVAVVAALGAYAYFTAPGSGTGYAVVGSTANIQLTSDTPSGIWPDGVSHPFNVYVTNSGGGPQYVGTISGNVVTFPGCLGSWFQVAPIVVNNYVPVGTTAMGTSITMPLDNSDDQSACAGNTLTIAWSS
jgi:hypothetical protein